MNPGQKTMHVGVMVGERTVTDRGLLACELSWTMDTVLSKFKERKTDHQDYLVLEMHQRRTLVVPKKAENLICL